MTTALSKIDPDQLDQTIIGIQAEINQREVGSVGHALAIAAGRKQLEGIFQGEVMSLVMSLQGSEIGFRTDKDSEKGYPENVVRDVVTSALVQGARLTGNEINIIASRLYLTREFYLRTLAEFDGLTNLKVEVDLPELKEGVALISGRASWTYRGQRDAIEFRKTADADTRIGVKRNKGQDHAAVATKGDRKIRQKVYERLTGTVVTSDPDDPAIPHQEQRLKNANLAEQSAAVRDDILLRVQGAGEIPVLEQLRDEIANAKDQGMVTHEDWKKLRDALNEQYRTINTPEPAESR